MNLPLLQNLPLPLRSLGFMLGLVGFGIHAPTYAVEEKTSTSAPKLAADIAPSYQGIWLGSCMKDEYEEEEVPAQDIFVIQPRKLTQYSYVFVGQKDCRHPSLMTQIEFTLTPRKARGTGIEATTQAQRIRVKALNVKAAIELSKRKECEYAQWRIRESKDCTQAEPYKNLLIHKNFDMFLKLKNGRLIYRSLDEDLQFEEEIEVFQRVQKNPFE